MSSVRKLADDKNVTNALNAIQKQLDDIIRRLGLIESNIDLIESNIDLIETNIAAIVVRLDTGDVDFT